MSRAIRPRFGVAVASASDDPPRTQAVSPLWVDVIFLSIDYDPEVGMLPAFAEALLEYARCTTCGARPRPDFGPCPCGNVEPSNASSRLRDGFDYRVDRNTWESYLEILWTRDGRRLYNRNSVGWRRRRQRIRSSDEPSYTTRDIDVLRDIQNESCYYCGASISENHHVEHLVPLSRGGSDGYDNIVLACPSCNQAKNALTERQFWRRLRKRMPEAEYRRLRELAKETKREKKRRRLAGRVPEGPFKRKRLIYSR